MAAVGIGLGFPKRLDLAVLDNAGQCWTKELKGLKEEEFGNLKRE